MNGEFSCHDKGGGEHHELLHMKKVNPVLLKHFNGGPFILNCKGKYFGK